MNTATSSQIFYYLLRGQQETGPYTLGQLRSMWRSGAVVADTGYRFDPSRDWQPLINLRQLLEAGAASRNPGPVTVPSNQSLVLPIVALVLAFVPLGCIPGVVCAHVALRRTKGTNHTAARVISIIALVVGYLALIHTALVLIGGSMVLFKPYNPPPDFVR